MIEQFKRHGQCRVIELRNVLRKLEHDDILIVNDVGNLAVGRNGKQIGYIDLDCAELSGLGAILHIEPDEEQD